MRAQHPLGQHERILRPDRRDQPKPRKEARNTRRQQSRPNRPIFLQEILKPPHRPAAARPRHCRGNAVRRGVNPPKDGTPV